MAKPARGEVWLVDMGFAAKVRPTSVLSVPVEEEERVLTTVVPHTTNVRETRFETRSNVRWLKDGSFDAQGIATFPSVKLIRKLGVLPADQLLLVEVCVRSWLQLP